MVDYAALRKKFPNKDPNKSKKSAAIKAIVREYERKRAEIGMKAPVLKKGIVFYAVIVLGLMILGSLVLSVTGKGGPARISRAQLQVHQSVDALATALGRYRYHVGSYPSTAEGIAALAEITPQKKGWNGPYIRQVVPDPWGHEYVYICNGEAETPTLYSKGADGIAGTQDDVIPSAGLYDEPFKDTSWTKGWMPYYLRGYVLARNEAERTVLREQVTAVLAAEETQVEGEYLLHEGWQFAQVWKDTQPASTNKVEHRDLPFDSPELEWKPVRIPHDWAIEGPFDNSSVNGTTAWLPWHGVGYYRRSLRLPESAAGKFIALRFDGVMSNPEVYLNGEKVGGWDYGYLGFEVDISDKFKFDEENTLVVKADTSRVRSRWYPGAGLFRDVHFVVEEMDDRVIFGSLKITTPEINATSATVRVEYQTQYSKLPVVNEFQVEKPILWDVVNPHLYETMVCGKKYRYGIRTAVFTADDGFHLNGRRVQLKGVDLHSDFGPLGMAFNRDAMRRQLEIMKDMGVNAIRTSHNCPDPQLLDLCDEMGFVVWDECFDKWDGTAGLKEMPGEAEDPDELVCRNLKQFVRRDRNHPCVINWSIGNEIWIAGVTNKWDKHLGLYPQGTTAERCRKFREAVLSEDTTRPVGMGCCFPEAVERGDYEPLDLTGWNYRQQYRIMHDKYPTKPVVYSESGSSFSSYGYYPEKLPSNRSAYDNRHDVEMDGYDYLSAGWGDIADVEFARMERDKFCAGEFVWTGIDYLGEPSPNWMLNRSSFFGICDLCAFPKDRYYLYRSHWNDREETIHLLPHWNWDGREGEKITVMCYTSGDEAELFVNGESKGKQKKSVEPIPDPLPAADSPEYYKICDRYRLKWEVPYEPGEIKVIVYRNGRYIGEEVRRTAMAPEKVQLTSDRAELAEGELAFIKVELVDDAGTADPLSMADVEFKLEGPGEIAAVGNSATSGLDSFKDVKSHPLHFGRALVVVRRTTGSGLPLKLTASSKGVAPATLVLPRK